MKKQLLSLLLVLCLVAGLIPAAAAGTVASGTCGENLIWTLNDGTLTISGEGSMTDYDDWIEYTQEGLVTIVIDAPWYDYRDSITSLIIENGVTTIGEEAFYMCNSITSVSLPDTLTIIDRYAFKDSFASGSLVIPSTVTSIGDSAFYNCGLTSVLFSEGFDAAHWGHGIFDSSDNLESVIFENGITVIPYECFEYCTNLKNVTIPESVISLEGYAFKSCTSLKEIDLPDSITKMAPGVFQSCSALETIHIPNDLQEIPSSLLQGCSSLTQVTIPRNVSYISSNVFFGCTSLNNIVVADENSFYSSSGGALYSKDKTQLFCVPEGIHDFYAIEDGVTTICGGAVRNFIELKGIGIPASVTTIKEAAFNRNTYGNSSRFDVYYSGTETQWQALQTGEFWFYNGGLESAVIHCNSTDPVSHPYVGDISEATCLESGKTTWTCACGHSYEDNFTQTVPHQYENGACRWCGIKDPNPFTDVSEGAFYYDSVLWAVEKNITSGITDTTFCPKQDCTRGQVVTFLWRAAGSPEPKSTSHPFTDVKEGAYYYKAMLWAVENNITKGTTATTFGPKDVCNRGTVVTFLHRAMGCPAPKSTEHPFTDVKEGKFYYNAMLWAVENEITSGISKTLFAPNGSCTRGQVVTFLYRAYAK